LISGLLPALDPLLDRPFSFFGHSMGTLVAYEMMRELRRRNRPMPVRAFMSGALPPNIKIFRPVSHLPDDQIIQELVFRYKVLPDGFAASRELISLIMPTVRADLALMENHALRSEAPFATPITAIGGVDDTSTPREGLAAWSEHTLRPLKISLVPGGHFYIRPPPRQLLQLIIEDLGLEPGSPPA
jgi:surfactin synthase thioesterase subunit